MNATHTCWLIDPDNYAEIHERIQCSDPEDPAAVAAAEALQYRAEAACAAPAPVVTDKVIQQHAPTRDPRVYVSIATYFWPNPDTPDGLPYIRKDGQVSPDTDLYDRPRWEQASTGIVTACKAALLLDSAACAADAVRRLRAWFLDEQTGMRPHLDHAQFTPGQNTGRCFGIIDFALTLPVLLDHVVLLGTLPDSPWTAADQAAMEAWCGQFLDWLSTSDLGRKEEATTNNHGVYFDLLATRLALFIGDADRARAQLEKTRARILPQIEPDGSMPRELARTLSLSYTLMNTRGLVTLASIGRRLGVDLWSEPADETRGRIEVAVDYLLFYLKSAAEWPYEQIKPVNPIMAYPILRLAGILRDRPYHYASVAHRMPADFDPGLFLLYEPGHPFGRTIADKSGP